MFSHFTDWLKDDITGKKSISYQASNHIFTKGSSHFQTELSKQSHLPSHVTLTHNKKARSSPRSKKLSRISHSMIGYVNVKKYHWWSRCWKASEDNRDRLNEEQISLDSIFSRVSVTQIFYQEIVSEMCIVILSTFERVIEETRNFSTQENLSPRAFIHEISNFQVAYEKGPKWKRIVLREQLRIQVDIF